MSALCCRICCTSIARAATRRSTSHVGKAPTSKANFSIASQARFPRRATPFRAARDESLQETEEEDVLLEDSAAPAEPWYKSETPITASASTSFTIPKETPPPPETLPIFLHPLWTHLFESPFFKRESIRFIDSRVAQSTFDVKDMDASVSSWVDWVVVATLRNGRERGIHGASDGVRLALQECVNADTSADSATSGKKGKRTIPRVKMEGLDIKAPQWCLVDGGKAIVHVMTDQARETWEVENVAMGMPAGAI